jgi:hypothetical protein
MLHDLLYEVSCGPIQACAIEGVEGIQLKHDGSTAFYAEN